MLVRALGLVLVLALSEATRDDAVDLRDVAALTFRRGRMTAGRRLAPVLQLACVNGGACSTHAGSIDVIQCTNVGEDDRGQIQWRCNADVDGDIKLGEINVSCEGYSSSSDPLKLRGSCGLEYAVVYTSAYTSHNNRHQHRRPHNYYDDHNTRQSRYMTSAYMSDNYNSEHNEASSAASTVLITGLVILGMVVCLREQAARGVQNIGGARGAYGARGGVAGGGLGAPPPPYGDRGGAPYGGGQRGEYFSSTAGAPPFGAPAPAGGAGFWTGAAAGGMLASVLGGRGYGGYGGGYGTYGGDWGGWGRRNTHNMYTRGDYHQRAASGYSSGGGGGGAPITTGTTRRSSGFGSTSTR